MNRNFLKCTALIAILAFAACTNDDPVQHEEPENSGNQGKEDMMGNRVFVFSADLPGLSLDTRGETTNKESLESCWATCFNHDNDSLKPPRPLQEPYFIDEEFDRDPKTLKYSPLSENCKAPKRGGTFEFFASFPSFNRLRMLSGLDNPSDYYKIVNKSTVKGRTLTIDFYIEKFRVPKDIYKQVDFLTARSNKVVVPKEEEIEVDENGDPVDDSGSDTGNPDLTVSLEFEHQLNSVDLTAWSNNDKLVYEFAGLRLGNANVEGTFHYNKVKKDKDQGPASIGVWENQSVGVVEYVYQKGDKVVLLDGTAFTNKNNATSIMGLSKMAMVIPTNNDKWEGRKDEHITAVPYNTKKSYFSVLLRVTKKANGKTLYPYPHNIDGMTIIYYAVGKRGEILNRLYPGSKSGQYFIDKELTQLYTAKEGETVKDFGWAAIPVDFKWVAGKHYAYKLNFSNGIGLHDPEDPDPGTPIVEQNAVPVTIDVYVSEWGKLTKEEIKVGADQE